MAQRVLLQDLRSFSVPLQVVPNTQLKHILSLWQLLAARRSMLLVQMNQVREMQMGGGDRRFGTSGGERNRTSQPL